MCEKKRLVGGAAEGATPESACVRMIYRICVLETARKMTGKFSGGVIDPERGSGGGVASATSE